MALLIDIKQPVWMKDEELRDVLLPQLREADIRLAEKPGNPVDIEMLAVSTYNSGEALKYPNLKLIQKLGAGVESILSDSSLPETVQIARLSSAMPAHEIAEYSLACVLQEQRHFRFYADNQRRSHWQALAPRQAHETTVAVMGLGRIGNIVAQRFLINGFRVIGWSRSEKSIDGIACFAGFEKLQTVLAEADYVVCILPSTSDTTGMFNYESFQSLKKNSVIINAGRGSLIDEHDLVAALDNDCLSRAYLDVMQTEPLATDSPMWRHPRITLTPHISGWHLGDAILDIAENFRRLLDNDPLINLVNRKLGY